MAVRHALRLLALAAALVVPSAALGAASTYVVRGDVKIGTYAVKGNGSLRGAISAFGTPQLRGGGKACTATWPTHGLTIHFYNLGGLNSCSPRYGRFSKAVLHGEHWRTDRGLRIGMSAALIQRYYAGASFHRGTRFFWPSGWWLVTRRSQFGLGGTYPGLLAETRARRVVAFHVRFAAGGD